MIEISSMSPPSIASPLSPTYPVKPADAPCKATDKLVNLREPTDIRDMFHAYAVIPYLYV